MKPGVHKRRLVTMMVALASLAWGTGHAAMSSAPAQTLYDSSVLVSAANMSVQKLDISSAGTLTVQLKDMKFPDFMNTLSFNLTTATQVFAPTQTLTNVGDVRDQTWSFGLAGPTTLYAAIFAKPKQPGAGNQFSAGLYYAKISFTAAVSPVPLPAAAWLLLSGLAGLVATRRSKHQLSQLTA